MEVDLTCLLWWGGVNRVAQRPDMRCHGNAGIYDLKKDEHIALVEELHGYSFEFP